MVGEGGRTVLDAVIENPAQIAGVDVLHVQNSVLAVLDGAPTLIAEEFEFQIKEARRGTAHYHALDIAAFGAPTLTVSNHLPATWILRQLELHAGALHHRPLNAGAPARHRASGAAGGGVSPETRIGRRTRPSSVISGARRERGRTTRTFDRASANRSWRSWVRGQRNLGPRVSRGRAGRGAWPIAASETSSPGSRPRASWCGSPSRCATELEITEICTRLLADGRAGGAVREAGAGGRDASRRSRAWPTCSAR